MKPTILILLMSATASFQAYAESCLQSRGVIDVGSSNTKVRVAKVDICQQKILSLQFSATEKVPYATENRHFSESLQEKGLGKIQELMKQVKTQSISVDRWIGFATSAFRTADNGAATLKKFSQKTGVPFVIIAQDVEAKLGFIAGIQASQGTPSQKILVWDIGGGSQQFTTIQKGSVQSGKIEDGASDRMKSIVVHEIKKSAEGQSPNPVRRENIKAAIQAASDLAAHVNLPVQEREEVIGVGGVLSASNPRMTGRSTRYSIEDLEKAIERFSSLNDDEINQELKSKDPYVETSVTNLILTVGVMKRLGFRSVTVSSYGTTEGALVYPDFWK